MSTTLSEGADYDSLDYGDDEQVVPRVAETHLPPQPLNLRNPAQVEESYLYYEGQNPVYQNTVPPVGHEYFE